MARLVIKEIDGSPSLELQDHDIFIWFDVVVGGRFDFPVTRGENLIYTETPGQDPAADDPDWFVADHLKVKLHGEVLGVGATATARRASFVATMTALNAILGYSGKVVRLVAHPPNEGLASGETATIDVQFVRKADTGPRGWEQEEMDLEFRSVTDPPGWTVDEAS